jgi:hypothetical protein
MNWTASARVFENSRVCEKGEIAYAVKPMAFADLSRLYLIGCLVGARQNHAKVGLGNLKAQMTSMAAIGKACWQFARPLDLD